MSARIDIVNYALQLLGAEPITSLEDDSREAKIMKGFYALARDGMFEEHEWSFATRRFSPAKAATDPAWGWGSSFPLPSDIIRLLRVDRGQASLRFEDMSRNQVPHEVEGRNILCNEDAIFCTGLRRIEDEGIYSPSFAEALSTKLALLACLPLTESAQKLQLIGSIHSTVMNTAKSRDAMQSTSRPIRSDWQRNVR